MNNKLVECLGINNLSKAGWTEVSVIRVKGDVLQINVGFHSRKSDVTKPGLNEMNHRRSMKKSRPTTAL